MSDRVTVGIDNGSSGSIGIITPWGASFGKVPTQDYLHYGQRGTISKRLDRRELNALLVRSFGTPELIEACGTYPWVGFSNICVRIERPFTGKFMNAVLPAHRFFEATICVLEDYYRRHGLGYEVVDSREWQKPMLGAGVKGTVELKKASRLRGTQLYPQFRDEIAAHGDADGLLIAHHFHHRA